MERIFAQLGVHSMLLAERRPRKLCMRCDKVCVGQISGSGWWLCDKCFLPGIDDETNAEYAE